VEVVPDTKALVGFARLNLLGSWPMRGGFSAIFCRNVMIYFDPPSRVLAVQRLARHLAPGGYLVVGHSESLMGIPHGLQPVQQGVFQKT
jgi:chemotaxis protein methyltransferase CheR